MVQRIPENDSGALHRKVVYRKDKKKRDIGEIVEIESDGRYKVQFRKEVWTFRGADLDFADIPASGSEPAAAAADVPGVITPAEPMTPAPTHLRAQRIGAKKWKVTLLNRTGEEDKSVGMAEFSEVNVRPYLSGPNKIVADAQGLASSAAARELASNAKLTGDLLAAHERYKDEWKAEQQAAAYRATAPSNSNRKQAAIVVRLNTLHGKAVERGTGHKFVRMTVLPLRRKLTLMVGGKDREITHLYTQDGGQEDHIRCYLGNAHGAYQRVHTTLEGSSGRAHTMVQTGNKVAVPGWERRYRGAKQGDAVRKGTRIGFRSVERESAGLSGRPLLPMSADECTTKRGIGHLKGQDYCEAKHGPLGELAVRFNQLLDAALRDVGDENYSQEVTWTTEDFVVLDDWWDETPAPEGKGKGRADTSIPPGSSGPGSSGSGSSGSGSSGSGSSGSV